MARPSEVSVEHALSELLARWTGSPPAAKWRWGMGPPDAVLSVGSHTLVAELAPDARAESIEGAIAQLRRVAPEGGVVPLLVVPYMTPAGAARCEAAGIAWADLSGNAHVEARSPDGDLWVHVSGQPNAFETRGRPRNAFAPKSARVARSLLAGPGKPRTQKEIVHATGLDAGHVSRIVGRLVKADLVAKDTSGRVVVPNPIRLLDAWTKGNAYRHDVVEGHLPGRSGEERARRLADVLEREGTPYALTGLAAAWAYTAAAGFRSVACYVANPAPGVLADAGFRGGSEAPNTRILVPDDAGVFDGVRVAGGLRCVAPAQAYVDLAHEPERADEFIGALLPLIAHRP